MADTTTGTGGIKTLAILSLLAGIWMIICPFALHASGGAKTDDVIFGILVIIVAAIRLGSVAASSVSWINVVFGIWLLISPFVLGWAGGIRWNNLVTGILIVIFSGINTQRHPAMTSFEAPTRRAA